MLYTNIRKAEIMNFQKFNKIIQSHFSEMTANVNRLFVVDVDTDEMWNLYLDSFPAGTNEIYRERREYDCSCCRHFVKSIGNVVSIDNGVVHTIWDVDTGDDVYQPVVNALADYVRNHTVSDVYISKFSSIGTEHNMELLANGDVIQWDHFYLELPNRFVCGKWDTPESIKGNCRDVKNVFMRSLNEISMDSAMTILELINSNTLYRGNEWKHAIESFIKYKKDYDKLTTDEERNLFAWEKSVEAGAVVGKIKNHSIGVLLVNITEGMDLDAAVTQYEKIVAPSNYKRPKAIFTKKMLEEAKETITEMGYLDSLQRRYAVLDDITVNNVLFSNKDSAKKMSGDLDIFEEMEKEAVSKPKKFSRVEEIPVDKFVKDVLPTATELEVYFENKHSKNLVSLIAPKIVDSKTMFKWDNNFSWSYAGNMADSMKDRVKAAGGKVDGVLRFSIQWNDIDIGNDQNDLDAHCITPNKFEIYFGDKHDRKTNGRLDVDIIDPGNNVAVENITWPSIDKMTPGKYRFFVHQYSNRGGRDGFRAEIEFDGQIYSFDYPNELHQGEKVQVAEVTLSEDGKFTIKELFPSNVASKEVWNIHTNQFIPVSVVCYSPNYWNEQSGIGNKHLFFMLKDCINPENPNGFFNEFLKEDLMKHKRVFEALGSKMRVEDCDEQLSGIGFCLTKRDDIVVKVKGNVERLLKVKF